MQHKRVRYCAEDADQGTTFAGRLRPLNANPPPARTISSSHLGLSPVPLLFSSASPRCQHACWCAELCGFCNCLLVRGVEMFTHPTHSSSMSRMTNGGSLRMNDLISSIHATHQPALRSDSLLEPRRRFTVNNFHQQQLRSLSSGKLDEMASITCGNTYTHTNPHVCGHVLKVPGARSFVMFSRWWHTDLAVRSLKVQFVVKVIGTWQRKETWRFFFCKLWVNIQLSRRM